MNSEKRNHERKNLNYEQILGKLQISFAGKIIDFNQVNDVSVSGMGLLISSPVSVGQDVYLGYQSNDFSVMIEAEVVWSETLSDGVFRLGLEFSNKNMDGNIMLFMALREFIDDFGDSF